MGRRTLADRALRRDAQRFVGRRAELALFAELLVDDPPANVVFVHGPGGIGKSTLLREVARRATALGWSVLQVDGRELALASGELEDLLAGATSEGRTLVLLDTYERMAALDSFLRRRLLPALPEGSVVVAAGRQAPGPAWFQDGWEHIVRSIALGPMDGEDARSLAAAYGVDDSATTAELVRWAAGSPLALAMGAEVARREGRLTGRDLADRPELVGALVGRLLGPQLDGEGADVIAVAAIARTTTAALLADVLPSVEPNAAQRWLREQAVTEVVGDGLAMHDVVRRAVRDAVAIAERRERRPARGAGTRPDDAPRSRARAPAPDRRPPLRPGLDR